MTLNPPEQISAFALPFQNFVKEQLGLPTLQIYLDPTLHAGIANHRILLRESLVKTILAAFPNVSENLRKQVLTPGTVKALPNRSPRKHLSTPAEPSPHQDVYFSLSHTQTCSGYAVASSGSPLGFDLEETARITPKLIQRIKHADDLPDALNSPLFWSAKEAAFKALFMNESSTLSQIAITSWDESQNGFVNFEAQAPGAFGKGVASKFQSLTIAIFLKDPSFSR